MNKTTHTPLPTLFFAGSDFAPHAFLDGLGKPCRMAELTLESPDNPGEHGGETIAYVSMEYDREIRNAVNSHDRLVEALAAFSRMAPSDEGLGGHAPLSAFIEHARRARALLAELEEKA